VRVRVRVRVKVRVRVRVRVRVGHLHHLLLVGDRLLPLARALLLAGVPWLG